MQPSDSDSRWSSPWFDGLAFAVGLAVAWSLGWSTPDLVWSLWLSSLVVGYATIVWTIARPILATRRGIQQLITTATPASGNVPIAVGLPILLFGGLFMLAFFTFHFGMFHFVHSVFLYAFFPVVELTSGADPMASWWVYAEVARRYWIFLPAAFIAERGSFLRATAGGSNPPVLPLRGGKPPEGMMAPYKNVVRMHLLIFFFAGAHFAGIDSFAVYAVVYAVYFFPWRILRRAPAAAR